MAPATARIARDSQRRKRKCKANNSKYYCNLEPHDESVQHIFAPPPEPAAPIVPVVQLESEDSTPKALATPPHPVVEIGAAASTATASASSTPAATDVALPNEPSTAAGAASVAANLEPAEESTPKALATTPPHPVVEIAAAASAAAASASSTPAATDVDLPNEPSTAAGAASVAANLEPAEDSTVPSGELHTGTGSSKPATTNPASPLQLPEDAAVASVVTRVEGAGEAMRRNENNYGEPCAVPGQMLCWNALPSEQQEVLLEGLLMVNGYSFAEDIFLAQGATAHFLASYPQTGERTRGGKASAKVTYFPDYDWPIHLEAHKQCKVCITDDKLFPKIFLTPRALISAQATATNCLASPVSRGPPISPPRTEGSERARTVPTRCSFPGCKALPYGSKTVPCSGTVCGGEAVFHVVCVDEFGAATRVRNETFCPICHQSQLETKRSSRAQNKTPLKRTPSKKYSAPAATETEEKSGSSSVTSGGRADAPTKEPPLQRLDISEPVRCVPSAAPCANESQLETVRNEVKLEFFKAALVDARAQATIQEVRRASDVTRSDAANQAQVQQLKEHYAAEKSLLQDQQKVLSKQSQDDQTRNNNFLLDVMRLQNELAAQHHGVPAGRRRPRDVEGDDHDGDGRDDKRSRSRS